MQKLITIIGSSLYIANINALTTHITKCTYTNYMGSLKTYEWRHTYRTYIDYNNLFPELKTDNHFVFLTIFNSSFDSADEYRYEMACDFENWDIAWKSTCYADEYITEGDELRTNSIKLFKNGEFITRLSCL